MWTASASQLGRQGAYVAAGFCDCYACLDVVQRFELASKGGTRQQSGFGRGGEMTVDPFGLQGSKHFAWALHWAWTFFLWLKPPC